MDRPRPDGPRPGRPGDQGMHRPPRPHGPPPAHIDRVRRHFHGYNSYWTRDWYHRHPGCWYPTWIPSYRWWYRPSWYETWGWFGTGFFVGAAVNNALDSHPYYPYYYGNNIVYQGNMVYVNGVPYVSADEYYRQALDLSRTADALLLAENQPPVVQVIERSGNGPVLAPAEPGQGNKTEQHVAKPIDAAAQFGKDWLPMGTFAFLDSEGEAETNRVIQLATNKEGQIRGNYVDEQTGTVKQLIGAVDPKTQRVALRFVDEEQTVIECGLWNLTQDTVPVLIHYDEEDTDQQTLVRLIQDEGQEETPKQEGPFLFGPADSELAP